MIDPKDSDASLLSLIAQGDADAIAAIYDRHCCPVYSLALRILGEAWRAEDVLHEVFMQVWRGPSFFSGSSKDLATALLATTCRSALDLKRRSEPRDQPKLPTEKQTTTTHL